MLGFNQTITLYSRTEDDGGIKYNRIVLDNCSYAQTTQQTVTNGAAINTSVITVRIPSKLHTVLLNVGDIIYHGKTDFELTEQNRTKFLSENKGTCFVVKSVTDNTFGRPLALTSHYKVESI